MPPGRGYRIEDQIALTSRFDIETARAHSPSFDKCHREITRLLQAVAQLTPGAGQ